MMEHDKKKLLVLLGAGSSIPLGMPSVGKLGEEMLRWGAQWQSKQRMPEDYYGRTWKALTDFLGRAKSNLDATPNFERALGEQMLLTQLVTPPPFGSALAGLIGDVSSKLAFPHPQDFGPAVTIADQLAYLLIELARHMRGKSLALDQTTSHWRDYKALLEGLASTFDIGIYNLNYDSAAHSALPGAFCGFADDGAFRPQLVHERENWNFVYHLHGSVHHSLTDDFGDAMRWQNNLAATFFDGHQSLSTDRRSDGRSFPKTTLIAGGFKLDQLLVEPFQSFHASFVRHAHEADAILLGGYGFGDEHVNRAIGSRCMQLSRRPPIMLLTRADDTTDPMAFRNDAWAYDLGRNLFVRTEFYEPGHVSPPMIDELVASGGFEVASGGRVAIWHGGFVEAAAHGERISAWLNGGQDAPLAGA